MPGCEPGMCLSRGGGGVSAPPPANPPTRPKPKKVFPSRKIEFLNRANTERPILGTQTFCLPSSPPPSLKPNTHHNPLANTRPNKNLQCSFESSYSSQLLRRFMLKTPSLRGMWRQAPCPSPRAGGERHFVGESETTATTAHFYSSRRAHASRPHMQPNAGPWGSHGARHPRCALCDTGAEVECCVGGHERGALDGDGAGGDYRASKTAIWGFLGAHGPGYMDLVATTGVPMAARASVPSPNGHPNASQRR